MATRYRQAIIPGACPECGGAVALKWARPSDGDPGFANAHCAAGHGAGSWHAGSYAACPVEEYASPADALATLMKGEACGRDG